MSKKSEAELSMTVAGQTSTELAVYSDQDLAAWGGNELSSKDIVIPSLLLLQSNSEFVKVNKGKGGEFFDSVSEESLGSKLVVVPFHMEKTWTVEKYNGKKWEWDHTEKMTPENENAPYEFEVGADKFRNKYTYRFYVLVDGHVLPFSLKLKGASKKTGGNISTEMYVKNAMKQLPPAAFQFELTSELEKNDEGDSYFVVKAKVGPRTPYEKVMDALNWFKTLRDDKRTVVVADDNKDF
jgi:hypothetical protein